MFPLSGMVQVGPEQPGLAQVTVKGVSDASTVTSYQCQTPIDSKI